MKIKLYNVLFLLSFIILFSDVLIIMQIYSTDKREISKYKSQVDMMAKKLSEVERVKSDELNYEKNILIFFSEAIEASKNILPKRDVPSIFMYMYKIFKECGVSCGVLGIGNLAEANNYNYYNLSFSISGSKQQIYSFLDRVENSIINIKSISISPSERGDLSVGLELKVYVLKNHNDEFAKSEYDFLDSSSSVSQNWYDIFNLIGGINAD